MSGFEIVETTADVGLRFFGKNEYELLNNLISGFYTLVFDEEVIYDEKARFEKTVLIDADCFDELVFKLAEDLIFYLYAKKKVIKLEKLTNNVEAVLNLYELKNFIEMEIKAATRHKFELIFKKGFIEGFIVFDI